MKGVNYKAYGCDEYANYISNDNGRTWSVLSLDAKEIQLTVDTDKFGRIIYGSLNDGGLTYSDDNGVTIEFSDHPTGNWDGILWTSDKVFAHSLDDGRIVYTLDWGEHWVDLIPGNDGSSGDNSGSLGIDNNGNLVISDGSGAKVVDVNNVGNGDDSSALIGIYPDAHLDGNGDIVGNDGSGDDYDNYDTEIDEYGNRHFKISGVLLILINKYLLPQIVYNLTGYTDPTVLGFNDGFTWGNVTYNNFFTDGQVYNISRNNSVLNLEEDVGMMPFNITASIFKQEEELNDISLTEGIKDTGDGKLKDTLKLIDKFLDIKRDYARQQISNIISDVDIDTSELNNLHTSNEDYANAVSTLQTYLGVQKGSLISIIGTMMGYIFSFDTQKKISLLKAAIYETIIKKVAPLNFQLKQLKEKLDNNQEIDASELDLSYNFSAGLEEAIKKYLECVMDSIKYLTQTNHKDLILMAADQYKSEYRPVVLEDAGARFLGVTVGKVNGLEKIKESEDSWRQTNSSFRGTLSDEDIENRLLSLDSSISNEDVENYINNIYYELLKELKKILDDYRVEDYWFDDYELEDFSNQELISISHYYKQITGDEYLTNGNGFKGRCVELLQQVVKNFVENSGGYETISNNLKEEILERNRQWLTNTNYSKGVEDTSNNFQKSTVQILKEGWYKNRRLI